MSVFVSVRGARGRDKNEHASDGSVVREFLWRESFVKGLEVVSEEFVMKQKKKSFEREERMAGDRIILEKTSNNVECTLLFIE